MTGLVASSGLSAAEVAQRQARGQTNAADRGPGRTLWAIVRANVLTRFNALIGGLLVLVLIFGPPQDGLFGLVIVVNSAVGIVQEWRAKRKLDSLALLAAAPVRVRRDGVEQRVASDAVVVDDLVLVAAGEKVPVDGIVVGSDGLEVDESLLTGEAEPVSRGAGARVLSGSFVAAGAGELIATGVGRGAYANRLVAEASRFDLAHSELMAGINRILRLITWVIVPIGVLLLISQLRSNQSFAAAMVGSVAGIAPMVPEGLVLMTSVAFAVGAIRLARRRCLVQQLPAIEVLARADVLCLDKTGTLTEPGMDLVDIRVSGRPPAGADDAVVRQALAAVAGCDPVPNPTVRAIVAALPPPPGWSPARTVPFSSARKYSAAAFDGRGAWVLGAPDVVLAAGAPERAEADRLGARGLRVLGLGRVADGELAADRPLGTVEPAALVVLRQRLRPDAAPTLAYLKNQGVAVKVFSGDNAASVAAVAAALDLPGAGDPVDARRLATGPDRPGAGPDPLADTVVGHSVFGRVTPQQKRAFVRALRSRGHTVGMTGDGVNDVLALKEADLGIAMGSGSAASRAVAKVVLLDDSFAALPRVLAEGRQVLGNIERVAHLFLIKTTYSVVLALLVGVAHVPFPFLPRHVTLVGSLTIGIPGFVLALAPNAERFRPRFVRRVLRLAVPAGLVCATAAFLTYWLARGNTASGLTADRTAATLTLFLAAACALALVARPYTWWRAGLVAAMVASFALVTAVPLVRRFFALDFSDWLNDVIAVGMGGLAGLSLLAVRGVAARSSGHRPMA